MSENARREDPPAKRGGTGRNDLLVGQIALEQKLISQEQLQEALREQAKQESPKPIGVILVAKGYLTDNQFVRVIDEQRRRMGELSRVVSEPRPQKAVELGRDLHDIATAALADDGQSVPVEERLRVDALRR